MQALVLENRPLAAALRWLTVTAPELSNAQAGQFVMVRCRPPTSHDPFLRHQVWVAQSDRTGASVLLVESSTPAGEWLAHTQPGTILDLLGPLGHPLEQIDQSQALLLIAEGPGLGALLPLATRAVARGAAVVLLAAAPESLRLPPYMLPPAVEYLATGADVLSLFAATTGKSKLDTPLLWADQMIGSGDHSLAARLSQRIRQDRFNWQPGFARFIVQTPLVCGVGLCGGCWHNTRRGDRLLCTTGPALDLRDAV